MGETIIQKKKNRFAIFTNWNFILLYLGGLVSRLGDGIYYIGLTWYVLDQSKSSLALGSFMMISTIPGVIFGPISGVLVDRLDRKKLIVWMDFLRGVIVLVLARLLTRGELSYPILLAGTFFISICSTLFNPAVSAMVPNIVDDQDLSKANSLENLSRNLTGVLGAGLGGVLIGLYGVAGAFMLNGVSYILSAISEIFIQMPVKNELKVADTAKENSVTQKSTFLQELLEGIKFILSNRLLRSICETSIVLNFFFIGAIGVGLPFIVKEIMGLGEMKFGMMEGFFPAGAIVGALAITILPELKKFYRLVIGGLALHGLILILIGISIIPFLINLLSINLSYWIIASLLLVMGIINVIINVPMITLFQRLVPDEVRGRFFAILMTFSSGLMPLAYFLSGAFLGILPAYILFVFGGIAVILVTVRMSRVEEFKRL